MMENEIPKVTKTEEKESFLKQLDEKISEQKRVETEIRALVERNEEFAARNLLGGKSDAGIQPVEKKEETPIEYARRVERGEIKLT